MALMLMLSSKSEDELQDVVVVAVVLAEAATMAALLPLPALLLPKNRATPEPGVLAPQPLRVPEVWEFSSKEEGVIW